MLSGLIILPLLGIIGLVVVSANHRLSKQVTLGVTLANLALSLVLWGEFDGNSGEYQFVQELSYVTEWQIKLGVDGLSLLFVILTCFIIPCSILASWALPTPRTYHDLLQSWPLIEVVWVRLRGIPTLLDIPRTSHYLMVLLLVESLLIGLFLVLDLLLFYICYESVLIPLFLMIGIWSTSRNKVRASYLLFLYTLSGSLFMLLAILSIYMAAGTTDYLLLTTGEFTSSVQYALWLGVFLALAIKSPIIPLHIWLPLAHSEAPLAGSILLAGIVLKMATYGFLRILVTLLPEASEFFTPLVYTLCLISILYSCLSTLRQSNLKSIIAYSSIGHMAIAILGVFSNTTLGIEGGLLLGFAHGLVSPALFVCVGIIYERWHTLIILYFRGLTTIMPLFALLFFIFCLANMGVPLTANFLGEFLSLTGGFNRNPVLVGLAASSMVLVAGYSIWLYNRVCFGSLSPYLRATLDINRREFYLLLPFVVIVVFLGVYPKILLDSIHFSVSSLLYTTFPLKGRGLSEAPGRIIFKNQGRLAGGVSKE